VVSHLLAILSFYYLRHLSSSSSFRWLPLLPCSSFFLPCSSRQYALLLSAEYGQPSCKKSTKGKREWLTF